MKRLLFLSLLFLAAWHHASAQIANDSLEYRIRPDSGRVGELYLNINNFNFFRNYEFFNDIQDGYTLFGTQLDPQLVYYPHPNLVLMAGVSMRKDYGGKGIYKTLPLFSIKYKGKDLTFVMGTLEGSLHHRFIEPMFDFERRITNPVEYGAQFLINKKALFMDIFVNWDNMIYKPSPTLERILAGGVADITLAQSEKYKLSLPLQFNIKHEGGQIDTVSTPNRMMLNGAIGFKFKYFTRGFIKSLSSENYALGFKDNSDQPQWAYQGGNGFFFNAGAESKVGSLILSYWQGNKYASSLGMPIYQSVSNKIFKDGYTEKQRQLLFIRYVYQKTLLPDLYLDARFEPVIDLKSPTAEKVQYYYSLFLTYKHDFRLTKKK